MDVTTGRQERGSLPAYIPRPAKRSSDRQSPFRITAHVREMGVELGEEAREYIRRKLGMKPGKFAPAILCSNERTPARSAIGVRKAANTAADDHMRDCDLNAAFRYESDRSRTIIGVVVGSQRLTDQSRSISCPCINRSVTAMYRPRPGDVLVSRSTARADRYSIWVVDAAAQTVARRFDEAMRTAKQLARRQKVDGWYTCDHTHFVLVAQHRSAVETGDGRAGVEERVECGRSAPWS